MVEVEREEEENGTREIGSTVSCSAQLGSAQPRIGSPVFFSAESSVKFLRLSDLFPPPPSPFSPPPLSFSPPPCPFSPAGREKGGFRPSEEKSRGDASSQIVPIHLLIRGSVNFLRKRAANIQSGA